MNDECSCGNGCVMPHAHVSSEKAGRAVQDGLDPLREAVIAAARKVHESQQVSSSTLAPGQHGIGGQQMTGWVRAEPFEELLDATYALIREEQRPTPPSKPVIGEVGEK